MMTLAAVAWVPFHFLPSLAWSFSNQTRKELWEEDDNVFFFSFFPNNMILQSYPGTTLSCGTDRPPRALEKILTLVRKSVPLFPGHSRGFICNEKPEGMKWQTFIAVGICPGPVPLSSG